MCYGYRIGKLEIIDEIEKKEDKERIFFKMFDFLKDDYFTSEDFNELPKFLKYEKFYIADKLIRYKGKRRFYLNDIVIASKKAILEFVETVIEENDLSSLLISPVFEKEPEYVIYIYMRMKFSW